MTVPEELLQRLAVPETWCAAAEELARRGDRDALGPLLRAYEQPWEASKVCLLDAMAELGAQEAAAELIASPQSDERVMAARLMDLLPAEAHLDALERAVTDPVPAVRAQARIALEHQRRTAAWRAALERLAASPDESLRALVAEWSDPP
jgi:hypothetical protein